MLLSSQTSAAKLHPVEDKHQIQPLRLHVVYRLLAWLLMWLCTLAASLLLPHFYSVNSSLGLDDVS